MGKGGVPDRWLDYSNIGHVVKGTRFVAFKVPLKPNILAKVIPGNDIYGVMIFTIKHQRGTNSGINSRKSAVVAWKN